MAVARHAGLLLCMRVGCRERHPHIKEFSALLLGVPFLGILFIHLLHVGLKHVPDRRLVLV